MAASWNWPVGSRCRPLAPEKWENTVQEDDIWTVFYVFNFFLIILVIEFKNDTYFNVIILGKIFVFLWHYPECFLKSTWWVTIDY